MGWPNNGTKEGAQSYFEWFKYEFWRFVFVQQTVGKALKTFIEYPPMQRGASFNLEAVKAEMAKRMPVSPKLSASAVTALGATARSGNPRETRRTGRLIARTSRRQ